MTHTESSTGQEPPVNLENPATAAGQTENHENDTASGDKSRDTPEEKPQPLTRSARRRAARRRAAQRAEAISRNVNRAAFAASARAERAERAAARGSALMDLEHEGRVFYTTLASAARAALSLTAGMVQHDVLDGPFACTPSNSAAAYLRSTHAEFCRFAEAAEAVYMRYERLKLQEIKQRFSIKK